MSNLQTLRIITTTTDAVDDDLLNDKKLDNQTAKCLCEEDNLEFGHSHENVNNDDNNNNKSNNESLDKSLQGIFDRHNFSFTNIENIIRQTTTAAKIIDQNTDNNSENDENNNNDIIGDDEKKITFNIVLNKFFNKIKCDDIDATDGDGDDNINGSLAKKFQTIDHDVKRFVDKVKEMNRKNNSQAIQYYNCGIENKHNDYHTTLSHINQAMIYGSNTTDNHDNLRKTIRKRATLFFENRDFVNASHDLEWLLLTYKPDDQRSINDQNDDDDWKLLKYSIISFYRLATKALNDQDFLGRKYALINLEKSEYFLQKLKILSRMNSKKYQTDLNFVYGQLNIRTANDEYDKFDRLRKKIHDIHIPDKPDKKLNHSNIFTDSKVLIDDHGNLIAGRTIEMNEKIFYEMMMTMLPSIDIRQQYQYKFCDNCKRRLGYRLFPCDKCTEVVYCDKICLEMSNKHHSKICLLSPKCLAESLVQNDQQMAICYDIFASLPIRNVIQLSRLSTSQAYHHLLKRAEYCPYPLFAYYNMLFRLSKSIDLNMINMNELYYQTLFMKSLQLSLVMKQQFCLTKYDLNLCKEDDEHVQDSIELNDLIHIIPSLMMTLIVLDNYYAMTKHMTIWDIKDRIQVGIGFGTFGLQLIYNNNNVDNIKNNIKKDNNNKRSTTTTYNDNTNVFRRFANNGKLEYIAKRRIEREERLQWISTSSLVVKSNNITNNNDDNDDDSNKRTKIERKVHFKETSLV
ncbi:uncharacterized protein LOC113792830 [Dermatophagoides pteronyssinus]|uniref:uncharacterized protein LOC113792830 n=1 Tax=Dermatophagoides pteronyssinus TaxID=6956 RepID=UPI003F67E30A